MAIAPPSVGDRLHVCDNGVWKPATVIVKAKNGFVAEWKLNAGADTITVNYGSTIPWRYADAAVSS